MAVKRKGFVYDKPFEIPGKKTMLLKPFDGHFVFKWMKRAVETSINKKKVIHLADAFIQNCTLHGV